MMTIITWQRANSHWGTTTREQYTALYSYLRMMHRTSTHMKSPHPRLDATCRYAVRIREATGLDVHTTMSVYSAAMRSFQAGGYPETDSFSKHHYCRRMNYPKWGLRQQDQLTSGLLLSKQNEIKLSGVGDDIH